MQSAFPHRRMLTLPGPPRTGNPRPARRPDLRQLFHHRPSEPGDLHRMRATPLRGPPNHRRAALPDLPRTTGADLLPLRRHHTMRNLPHDRPPLVPELPTPNGNLLELLPPRCDRRGNPDAPALRRLRTTTGLARL